MSILDDLKARIDQLMKDTEALDEELDEWQITNNKNCIAELKSDLVRLQKLIDGHLSTKQPESDTQGKN
jgi:peptidoglycan hydrolase CwlO-like protein